MCYVKNVGECLMRDIDTTLESYEISNDYCGNCYICENKCNNGKSYLKAWSPEEVAEVCDLLMESSKFVKELKSLGELR